MKVQFIGYSDGTEESTKMLLMRLVDSQTELKFVAFSTSSGEKIVNIYGLRTDHSVLFSNEKSNFSEPIELLGAGYCSTFNQEFNSSTCKEVFGFDRPEDFHLRAEILKAIKDFFKIL